MHNLQIRPVQFKDQEKKLKKYLIVSTGLSMNENTKRPQTETTLNPLDLSEICCIIYRHSTHTIH